MVLRVLVDFLVELSQIFNGGEAIAHHQLKLGTKESDSLGAGGRELGKIEQ
jgi:hypothetical protein